MKKERNLKTIGNNKENDEIKYLYEIDFNQKRPEIEIYKIIKICSKIIKCNKQYSWNKNYSSFISNVNKDEIITNGNIDKINLVEFKKYYAYDKETLKIAVEKLVIDRIKGLSKLLAD